MEFHYKKKNILNSHQHIKHLKKYSESNVNNNIIYSKNKNKIILYYYKTKK